MDSGRRSAGERRNHANENQMRPDFFSEEYALKDTIRFLVSPEHRQVKDLNYIHSHILSPILNIERPEYFCVQSFFSRGIYDITLENSRICERVFSLYELNRENAVFEGIKVAPLFQFDTRLLTIQMYSPFITDMEIESYLRGFCDKVILKHYGKTSFGAWNGKRVYLVSFKKDPEEEGGVSRPPPVVFINRSRGYLFFSGMPQYCRDCKRYGHSTDNCDLCADCPNAKHQADECPARDLTQCEQQHKDVVEEQVKDMQEGAEEKAKGKEEEEAGKRRKEEEEKKVEAEKKKVEAEAKKVEAEAKKVEAEAKKVEAEKKKVEAEKKKVEAEKRRKAEEKKKIEAEKKKEEELKKLEADKRREDLRKRMEAEKAKKEKKTKASKEGAVGQPGPSPQEGGKVCSVVVETPQSGQSQLPCAQEMMDTDSRRLKRSSSEKEEVAEEVSVGEKKRVVEVEVFGDILSPLSSAGGDLQIDEDPNISDEGGGASPGIIVRR